MRVFVAGGSGVLGRRLVPRLVARGHRVTATTTRAAGLEPLDPMTGTAAEPGMAALAHVEDVVVRAGGAVLRYGWFYGPGATADLAEPVRKRRFPVVGGGAGHCSWVHLDDAAAATVLAVEQSARGVFNIVDDEPAPASEWLPHLAACAGAGRPMRVPAWLARPLAGAWR
ncbi:NAD-dependent epimerase/dehydratase family protein [Spirillospora sp. NPDC048824]|uniref:NAD-dependent epimerase/dehydratase family protein n=1 Tax=Spirillospora sp. NPDC048824 TaxID=3364526 RepID=UPI003717EF03